MSSSSIPIPPHGATCLSQLKIFCEETPHKPAFIFIDKNFNKTVLTRKAVCDNCRRFAAILRRHDVKKGDIVCNTLVNSPERLITALGTTVAGATSMHGHVLLKDGEDFIHNCRVSKCKAVIIDPGQQEGAADVLKRIQLPDDGSGKIRYDGLPALSTILYFRVCCPGDDNDTQRTGLQDIEEEKEMFEELDIEDDDIAFIFLTSGTTGFSKLVPHTHRTCLLTGRMLATLQGVESGKSKYFSDRSLGWLGGFAGPYLVTGATRILTDYRRGMPEMMAKHMLRLFNEADIDCGVLLAHDVEILVKYIKSGAKLNRRLRNVGITGMPLSKRILKAFGVIADSIRIGYGSTEVGYVSILHLEPSSSFEDYCVGVAAEGYEMKVVDDDYNEVSPKKNGHVILRGCTTMAGYLNEPQKTTNAFTKDGFFKPGDVAYKDENGLVYVLGRENDAIHKGIFIHYPGWMESRILECPGVEQVTVIGVPDPVNYEEICVCVIPSEDVTITEQSLYDYCKNMFMADKISEISAMAKYFLFADSFPLNANGKLNRKALRSQMCERLNIKH